jgi:hypothetical protein
MFTVPEKYRLTHGPMRSSAGHGNNGVFLFPAKGKRVALQTIASDGEMWEHVSVVVPLARPPSWEEMCFIKDQFWSPEDTVMQLHVPQSELISNHNTCLHLWRPVGYGIPRPPGWMVGIQGMSEAEVREAVADGRIKFTGNELQ